MCNDCITMLGLVPLIFPYRDRACLMNIGFVFGQEHDRSFPFKINIGRWVAWPKLVLCPSLPLLHFLLHFYVRLIESMLFALRVSRSSLFLFGDSYFVLGIHINTPYLFFLEGLIFFFFYTSICFSLRLAISFKCRLF